MSSRTDAADEDFSRPYGGDVAVGFGSGFRPF